MTKRTILIIGLLVVGIFFLIGKSEVYTTTTTSNWHTVLNIGDKVWAISDQNFDVFYLVAGEEKALLIDSGLGIGNVKEVVSSLTSLPVEVVNTHGHFDHTYGNYFYDNVYISEEDMAMMKNAYTTSRRQGVLKYWVKNTPLPDDFSPEIWQNASLTNVLPVKDGHVFNLGGRNVEVIAVPGHTAGSICLLDDRSKTLFTGDVINCGEIWMHLGESVSLPEYVQSLKKLALYSSRFERICWGHSNAPIPSAPSFLDDVIVKVQGITENKYQGELRSTTAGQGYYYSFKGFRIITPVR